MGFGVEFQANEIADEDGWQEREKGTERNGMGKKAGVPDYSTAWRWKEISSL